MKYFISAALILGFVVTTMSTEATTPRFLVAEWNANYDHFCQYDDGTVMNVGFKICPLII